MILIGIGSNLQSPEFGNPRDICYHSLLYLEKLSVKINQVSHFYKSTAQPVTDQPDYCNAVASIEVPMQWSPQDLLAILHQVETAFDRKRSVKNAPRTLDLDLLDFNGLVKQYRQTPDGVADDSYPATPLVLPHPRMHERAFVLMPLRDICKTWRHPVSGLCVNHLLKRVEDQEIERLQDLVTGL